MKLPGYVRRMGAFPAALAALWLLGSRAAGHSGLHEQIEAVTLQIQASPSNALLYLQRAELHRLHENYKAAAADLASANRLSTNLPTAYLVLGRLLADQRQFPAARAALDSYVARVPADAQGFMMRARLLVRLGENEPAVIDFNRAIKLSPEPPPELYLERAQALVSAGDVAGALRGLDEGLAQLGPLVTLQLRAVELERGRKQFPAALSRLDSIVAHADRREKWLVMRGDILCEAGRTNEAVVAYQDANLAIAALPERLRETKVMADLKTRADTALTRSGRSRTTVAP